MNVCYCLYSSAHTMTGVHAWLTRIVPALRARGVEASLFAVRLCSGRSAVLDGMRAQGVPVREVKIGPAADLTRTLLDHVRANGIGAVVTGDVLPALYASRWLIPAGIPTIGVLHNDDAVYRAIVRAFIAGPPAYRASAVVCVSRVLEDEVRRHPHLPEVVRIPYGAPIPDSIALEPRSTLRLLYAGRLEEPQKRSIDLARAFCKAACEVPGVEGWIIGNGPSTEAVGRIIAAQGHGKVQYLGRKSYDEVQPLMARAHVISLLSEYEGLPVSLMEAMACGLVPVCTAVRSGIPELVEHGATGLLVDDRDAGFVAAVRRLKTEPGLWRRLSLAARDKVATEYALHRSVDRWLDLFATLTGVGRPNTRWKLPRSLDLPDVPEELARLDRPPTPPLGWIRGKATSFFGRTGIRKPSPSSAT